MLVREGRAFLWYVASDRDSADEVLRVFSEDKRAGAEYQLGQAARPGWTPHAFVRGAEFAGAAAPGRYATPRWRDVGPIGPGFVRRLLDWFFDPSKSVVPVSWDGVPLDGAR